jgi:hypothetical protein
MNVTDIEDGKKDFAEYLTKFYGAQPPNSSPSSAAVSDSGQYDPVAIGTAAKERRAAVWKKGGQLSATEAVAEVLREQGKSLTGR